MQAGREKVRRRARAPLGSRILGSGHESAVRRRVRVQTLLTVVLLTCNLVGAATAIVLIAVVVPGPPVFASRMWVLDFALVPAVTIAAFAIGLIWITRGSLRQLRWAVRGEPATAADLRTTLAMPFRITVRQAVLWYASAAILTAAYATRDLDYAAPIAFTVVFSGTVTCATSYLFSEFALRPTAAQALASAPPARVRHTGVTTRMVAAWLIGTGIPVLGLMIIAVTTLTVGTHTLEDLAVPVFALGGVTLAVGLLLTLLVCASTLAPINSVRSAMAEVERGRLDAEAVVFDGTELGELQRGFNEMARGLRERERIREVFGRHVGHEVADYALSGDFDAAGREVEVAVLFVDIIGSTTLAAHRPPATVVALLNRFFAVVVDEVDLRRGLINKFEGDAALAVFGAPAPVADPCTAALEAARTIGDRLRAEVPELAAGIGVSYGTAVAGNIGAHRRYEYTVIGDAVNEAARLSEYAKRLDRHTVAAGATWRGATADERRLWRADGEAELRGRAAPTSLFVPCDSAATTEN
ncbi:adenylate/guanylate cyclase domain-containing protein [Tomitella fengzijianii]|uniref:Adenylate/guanylate cyclase domain-containing protein n=1 Tax=Tomitella fengzijianii TaxID=2597660 RepID=A0A516X450_9ACTN|nr:adenylate/guanylate cyclase domain-containing protein [Tomitella fengzijianii]QDQ97773.1 adenylate/guanylate cyclase domain-containing protein [Tomitella fengzijianii]